MRHHNNYNRLSANTIAWKSGEWYVDKYGQLKLKESYDDAIEMITLVPVYSDEELVFQEVKE